MLVDYGRVARLLGELRGRVVEAAARLGVDPAPVLRLAEETRIRSAWRRVVSASVEGDAVKLVVLASGAPREPRAVYKTLDGGRVAVEREARLHVAYASPRRAKCTCEYSMRFSARASRVLSGHRYSLCKHIILADLVAVAAGVYGWEVVEAHVEEWLRAYNPDIPRATHRNTG